MGRWFLFPPKAQACLWLPMVTRRMPPFWSSDNKTLEHYHIYHPGKTKEMTNVSRVVCCSVVFQRRDNWSFYTFSMSLLQRGEISLMTNGRLCCFSKRCCLVLHQLHQLAITFIPVLLLSHTFNFYCNIPLHVFDSFKESTRTFSLTPSG